MTNKPDCIFCKIITGEMDSAKIWEDEKFMAFLDINPNTKGMAVLVSKEHFDSYALDMPDIMYEEFFLTAKKVGKLLQQALKVERVALVMEGMGVNHAHIKLYPLHGLEKELSFMDPPQRIFFEKYEGYISTQLGPQVDMNILKELAEDIKRST